MFSRRHIACALTMAVAGLVENCALAVDAAPLPDVFTFAAGYKTDTQVPENIVELGVLKKCGRNGWCMDLSRYESAKMLPRVATGFMHAMHAPYGNGTCSDGAVTTIDGSLASGIKVKLTQEQDGFSLAWSDLRYRWIIDPKAQDGYTLADITHKNGGPLEQVAGFGFSSQKEWQGNPTKGDLAYYYKGEIFHKTAFTKVEGPWSYAPSTFDFRPYQENPRGDLLVRSTPGNAAIIKKYGRPMWVQSSIVLERGTAAVAPLIQEYGHDFNMDGCFNESGHNKLMLPIGKDSVTALVYVEYTPDLERGFPMLSVGRYYR